MRASVLWSETEVLRQDRPQTSAGLGLGLTIFVTCKFFQIVEIRNELNSNANNDIYNHFVTITFW